MDLQTVTCHMNYDSSDEEVWEEEKVSGDDDSNDGPGFLDPTRRAPGLHDCGVSILFTLVSVKS